MADISTADDITYSFVIPVHNEEEVLGALVPELGALRNRLDGSSEVVFVDDGSTDDSWSILTTLADLDPSISLVRLSRNFGHQIAVTAGLEHSTGECAVIMDADLQDPPHTVLEMSRRWREGYHVVFGVRTDRQQDTRFKRATAAGFYRCLNALSDVDIPAQVGDFRLIDRSVIDAIAEMPERNRYVRGMFAWLGFRQIGVEYARPARAAGTTSYGLKKMLRLANDGVIGYSKAPIRSVTVLGAVLSTVSAAAVIAKATGLSGPPTALRSAGAAGVQLVALGLIGEYVARIFDESTDRPLYVTQEVRRRLPRQPSSERDRTMAGVERHGNVRSLRTRQDAELADTHR